MRLYSLLSLALCVLPAGLQAQTSTPAVNTTFVEKMATREHIEQLRRGGYVLYIRHGNTDNSRPDRFPSVDLNDCNTQRPLNDEGRQLMREVGKEIRAARLPIGEILVSPMCRTRESAKLALGEKFTVTESLMYSANMTSEEKKPRLEALKKILAKPVPPGSNRILLAHAPNLADLIGFFIKPEGTVVIFAQRGPEKYEYVASIHPATWSTLR